MFNIIAGGAGVFGGLLLTALVVGMGGSSSEAMFSLSLATAGALFALSGGFLFLSPERARRAGGAGAFGGLLFTAIVVGLGGSSSEAMIITLFLATAGAFFALSGGFLFLFPERARRAALGLLVLAILGGLIYFTVTVMALGTGLDPGDEEIRLFVLLPGLVILVAVAELLYLWREKSISNPA